MSRSAIFCIYMVLAILIAGLFGVIHDQISYTVSSEYFTRFKFPMFHLLDPEIPERIRASQVGFLASWWMGIPLGILTGMAGFLHKMPEKMFKSLLWSLLVISGFTLGFALLGLAYGYYQTQNINLASYNGWYIPAGVVNIRSFVCVGYMHNSAYLGGALAVPVAWLFHLVVKHRAKNSP